MSASSSVLESDALQVRRAQAGDLVLCGPICYEAFTALNRHHNFPPDFPNLEVVNQALGWMFSHEKFYCVVAELDGKTVGSNCLDERSEIAGVGPITVDPAVQNKSVGRSLMLAVMDRAARQKAAGIRLVQMAFNNRSLSLYTKLGFDVMEPLSVMNGPAIRKTPPGYMVRSATSQDTDACDSLCRRVHGHGRRAELLDGIVMGTARVAEYHGRITAYASAVGFFGHAVAESTRDLQALISATEQLLGPGILVPTRNAALFRWCLEQGLRVVEPATLMSVGLYNQPAGAFLPSIAF
jgi:GNAT superfamily N-acetyltransferase